MADTKEIDTTNRQLVSVRGDAIVVINPPHSPLTKQEALTFAAYLVVLVGDDEAWLTTYGAVCKS